MNLLYIEDDARIGSTVNTALARQHKLDVVRTGHEGYDKLIDAKYDVIMLDLGLPDTSGLDFCRKIRSAGYDTPVIVVTGEDAVMSKIKLLDAGADDYLTKPFTSGELGGRLRALHRRAALYKPDLETLVVYDLCLNRTLFTVERSGVPIRLRRKEFSLLECLMEHPGSVMTREALATQAWHVRDEPWTNTIEVHIKSLRDKIDRPFTIPLIRTVYGLGYKIQTPYGRRT